MEVPSQKDNQTQRFIDRVNRSIQVDDAVRARILLAEVLHRLDRIEKKLNKEIL